MKFLYKGMEKVFIFLRVWNYFWEYEKVSFGFEENPIFAKKYFHTLGYENIGCFSLMRHRRVHTHQVRKQLENQATHAQDKLEQSGQVPQAAACPRSHLSRLSSWHCHHHRGHVRGRQPRLYQLRNNATTVRRSLQQTRPLQRRGPHSLVPRHSIWPQPHHRNCQSITRTVHQQAPDTLAHVRLQPNKDTVLHDQLQCRCGRRQSVHLRQRRSRHGRRCRDVVDSGEDVRNVLLRSVVSDLSPRSLSAISAALRTGQAR